MVKRFVILRKKKDMTKDEFWNYWENVHGKLIGKIPGLTKYIQYHVNSEIDDDIDKPIDGIAELWFENEEEQKKAYSTAEYKAVVEDEPNLFEMNSHFVHPVMTKKVVHVK
jgi:uncharacterized protein (TIGR02118 family)